jgi:adenylosuccinate synthase
MIMPWHIARDSLRETARGDAKVGTTGRGIGPLYADRTERVGVRMGDMLKENFEKIILRELDWQTKLIALMDTEEPSTYLESLAPEKVLADFRAVQEILAPMIGNPLPLIWEAQKAGKEILGEGAQGILLDIDLGTYPFVTSSHPGVTGFSIATGLQQNDIARVIGVTKAYQTRVGEGPMPTELLGEVGDKLRELGNEYGATTGRPRRCGWLDLPSLRYSLQVGGVNSIALTKIDVLDGMDEIKICTHYEHNGKKYDTLPTADAVFMAEAKAIYKTMPKWDGATFGVKDFSDFPQEAQDYVQYIEDAVGVSVEIISNGPAREEVFYRV